MSNNNNKTARIAFRLTPLEHESLGAIAQIEGLKPSEALRAIIRNEAQRRGVWPVPVTRKEGGDCAVAMQKAA